MKMLLGLTAGLLLGVATLALADDKQNGDKGAKGKIVGVWEVASGDLPKGSTIEFTKDGKVKFEIKAEGKNVSEVGTYVLDGETIKTAHQGKDGKDVKEVHKIKKLTDSELVTEDEKGKVEEFKKK
jgi:uncharacterized protein (TIGR03066 family)